jgi:hypothetical protein
MSQCRYSAKFNSVKTILCDYNLIANEDGERIVIGNFDLDFKRFDYIVNEDPPICSYQEKSKYWAKVNQKFYKSVINSCSDFKIKDIQHLITLYPLSPQNLTLEEAIDPSKTPSVTPSKTATPSKTPSVTPSKTPSVTLSVTPSKTATPSKTPGITPSKTPSITPSKTASITPSKTPSVTPSKTATPSKTPSITPSKTASITPSKTPSVTPSKTATPSKTPSITPSKTASITPSKTPSVTPSKTATPSKTPSITPSKTASITPSKTPSITVTNTPTPSITASLTPSITNTVSPSASISVTPTITQSISITPTPTITITPTITTSPWPIYDGWVPDQNDLSGGEEENSNWKTEEDIVLNPEGAVEQWGDGEVGTFYAGDDDDRKPTLTTLNGLPAINFDGREDGNGDYLNTLSNESPLYTGNGVDDRILENGLAFFIAGYQDAAPDGFGDYDRGSIFRHSNMWISSHAPWNDGRVFFDIDSNHCYGAAGSDQATCEANGGEWHTRKRINSDKWMQDRAGNQITGHYFIGEWLHDSVNTTQQIWKNGTLLIENTNSNPTLHVAPDANIRLAQAGYHQKVVMGEIIILDYYPDQKKREKIEGYLGHKWRFPQELDPNHPFLNFPPSKGDTTLLQPVTAGSNELTVHDQSIFNAGDYISIDAGEYNAEIAVIQSFGSLILQSNLQHDHSAGASISIIPPPSPSQTPTPTPTITQTPTITPTLSVVACGILPAQLPMELCAGPAPSPSVTASPSLTPSLTPTVTKTPSYTPSVTPSMTLSLTPSPTVTNTPSITISQTISPTPSQEPGIQLTPLDNDIDVTVVDFNYVFDNKSSIDNTFGINLGTYTFRNVPQSHAIGFYRKDKPVRVAGMSYADQHIGNDGNTYDYYYGDVVLDVTGDFGVMSYDCINHGFMGGENNLVFDPQATQFANQGLTVTLDYTNYTENALSNSDKDTIRSMADSFEEVILTNQTFPIDVTNFTQVTPAGGGTLAYAGRLSSQYLTSAGDPNGPYGIGYWQSTAGFMAIDPNDVNTLRQVTSEPEKNSMYWVMLHEVGHAFGIGFWNTQLFSNNGTVFAGIADNLIRLTEADGAQYIGAHAVREYNKLVGGNFTSLPIQTFLDTSDPDPSNNDPNAKIAQNFISPALTQQDINNGFILHNDPWRPPSLDVEVPIPNGTIAGQTFNYTLYLQWGGHWAELTPDSGQRTLDGELQPYITEELMTPYINVPGVAPMTRITLGFLHDLGFLVDYSKIDPNS